MPTLLIVTPQADEAEALCRGFAREGLPSETVEIGRLTCTLVPPLDALAARSFHENRATVVPNVSDLLVAWRLGTQASRALHPRQIAERRNPREDNG